MSENYTELVLSLDLPPAYEQLSTENAKKAQKKKKDAGYVPTWDENWSTGWIRPSTGKRVAGILQSKLTDTDLKRLLQVKEALEAGQLQRIPAKAGKPVSKSEALDLYPILLEQIRAKRIQEMIDHAPANYRLVNTVEQLEQLCRDLHREPVTGFDVETTGLNIHGTKANPAGDRIVGFSITLPEADYHVYVPFGHTTGEEQLPEAYVFDKLRFYLESPGYKKVLHNSKFDAHMVRKHGVRFRGIHHDTQYAQKILNELEDSYALKNLSNKYGELFGYKDDSFTFEDLFGKDANFAEVPIWTACVYASKDTHLTYLLYRWQRSHFKRLPRLEWLYDRIENPLIETCLTMERTGFLIDLEYAAEYGKILDAELTDLDKQMRKAFDVPAEFNFNSPEQLSSLLFDKLSLRDPSKGQRSTEAGYLKQLQGEHAGIAIYLEYKEKKKLYGTYVESLPEQVCSDGRVRGQFDQLTARTGRFGSSAPNLQNLPPAGKKLFVAPEGWVILGSDFSQIEPRVLAHISKDPELQQIYKDGRDLYIELAAKVFNLPRELCADGVKPPGWKKEPRKMMKTGLLAVMYGISMYSLRESLGMDTVEEAAAFIDDFYAAYPGVYAWIQSIHAAMKRDEFVETLYGRKRRFPGHRDAARQYDEAAAEICRILGVDKLPLNVWAEDIERKKLDLPPLLPYKLKRKFQDVKGQVEAERRQGVNAVIQGSAADIMKLALIALDEYLESRQDGSVINGTVHDEALSQVPATITREDVEHMESLMLGVAELDVPLKVDTEIFLRWGEGISKNKWYGEVA